LWRGLKQVESVIRFHECSKVFMIWCMRTTITLEADVAASLKRLEKRGGVKFKALVNRVLREGLKRMVAPPKKRSVFRTRSVDLGACRAANVDNVGEVLAIAEGKSFR
jgi:hypothetical protein